jgi:hypothetical protein
VVCLHSLVYVEASEIDELWLLGSLLIKQSYTCNQISLFIITSVSLPSFNEEQNFVLKYAADDLVPDTTTLAINPGSCDAAWLAKIARYGVPKMHTLSLTL